MKNTLFILLFLVSFQGNSKAKIITQVASRTTEQKKEKDDSLMFQIQSKIYGAFVQSITSNKKEGLDELLNQLTALYQEKEQKLIQYWQSYLYYYRAVYYLQQKDKTNSEREIDKGVVLMEKMNKKNSEDYALLAKLQSFSIQFKGMKAASISRRIKENGNLAITLDSTNMRAYQVLGVNDYYTPKLFGGGKQVEKYLLKAIDLPEQKTKNHYLPSWGKEEAYEYLIRFYIKNENWEEAKKYYQEAITTFPESYTLNRLASNLVGK